jgi:hypothetical protein
MLMKPIRLLVHAAFFTLALSATASAIPLSPNDPVAVILAQGEEYEGGGFVTGPFSDVYKFSLPSGLAGLGTLAISLPGSIGKIKNLSLSWSGGGPSIQITDGGGLLLPTTSIAYALGVAGEYLLTVTGDLVTAGKGAVYEITLTTTPLPPALLLFGSGLAGLTLLGRRSKRREHI